MNDIPDIAGVDIEPAAGDTWTAANWRAVELGLDWIALLVEAARDPKAAPGGEAIEAARAAYESARDRLSRAGTPAAIDRLSAAFGLSPFDEDVSLLALAARIDASFPVLFGTASGRGPAHPTLDLALRLFTGLRGEPAVAAHLRLGTSAPLRRFALLFCADETGLDAATPLILEESVARYLIGDGSLDHRVTPWLTPVAAVPLASAHRRLAEVLAKRLVEEAGVVELCGPARCGRRAIAVHGAAQVGLLAFELRPPRPDGDLAQLRAILTAVSRAARLHGLLVVFDAAHFRQVSAPDNRQAGHDAVAAVLAGLDCPVTVLQEEPHLSPPGMVSLAVTALGDGDRLEVWREAVASRGGADERLLADLATQFTMGPAEIAQVAADAASFERPVLWSACRERSRQGLEQLGERIIPRATWHDIILPDAVMADLKAIAAQARHRATVYHGWGFAERLVRNAGVTAMFAGPSGVGKTMAAEVICRDLDLDLIRIDLSGVVSKYIGETEKNLKRVFDAAEQSGAVLFFDEADALFGKRSEVKDSHDRYANIEVSYLLQRMEAYGGLAVLATNMKSHIDPAFLRRLRYVVDLPFPTSDLRAEIWRRAFPPKAPRQDLDFEMLARLDITGGNIVVIAVNAAFLAAEDGRPIAMNHVVRAARAEFRKLDREFRLPWPGGAP